MYKCSCENVPSMCTCGKHHIGIILEPSPVCKEIPLQDLKALRDILISTENPEVNYTGDLNEMRLQAEWTRKELVDNALERLDKMIGDDL